MKPSLRAGLLQAIRDYTDLRAKLSADYDELKAKCPEEAALLISHFTKCEDDLDVLFKQASPEMNVLEQKRYCAMIGSDRFQPKPVEIPEGPVTEYPPTIMAALAKVKAVFPNAKILAFAKPGERLVEPPMRYTPSPGVHRNAGDTYKVVGVHKDQPAPPAPTPEPEQPKLF